ncbi:MAG: thioredoxin [Hydrococcus sp. RU_2_2]|jgi:thioredoxin 1|nr:thioredoxin [Hydrococcus sp. RU_2_2]NJP22417.1 thioredoxin [Hydrococcus sp. CRU_1_1]NJQ97481.1 thioredoxin [Hydrococcus sp. CSU_1_8]
MMLSVNEKNFSDVVLNSSEPVIVHFWAPWCGLCRLIVPLLHKAQSDSAGHIQVVGVNADENFKLANTYRLKSLPTIILFENGQIVRRIEGFNGRDELQRNLNSLTTKVWAQSA